MTYTELFPTLIRKNLVQTRSPPPVLEKIPWWYKADAICAFHQNAPGHGLEDCWPLKVEVQRLVRAEIHEKFVRKGLINFNHYDGPVCKKDPLGCVDVQILIGLRLLDDEMTEDQAYVDHDVTLDQFNGVVSNITACNNLSFSDENFPKEGSNHNLALHISVGCKDDSLSNVLIDSGSLLNVMPKSNLVELSYGGTSMRYNNVIVKAFNGSKKSIVGEVDLHIRIGPFTFQDTF
ncbi:uncharacterized protein LOC131622110 [Vicia villosa]|uniref:uncharacterized protein LOC131622110 n=1 Tax=Vicia villosa TaxID=3911 RepID=UPI00273AD001|nr:uncharacterized protein LOC131622110 [Vicia villosa]